MARFFPLCTKDHDHSGDAGDGGQFDAANLTSGAATDGQVLTADGSSGAAWEDASGGGLGWPVEVVGDWTPGPDSDIWADIKSATGLSEPPFDPSGDWFVYINMWAGSGDYIQVEIQYSGVSGLSLTRTPSIGETVYIVGINIRYLEMS